MIQYTQTTMSINAAAAVGTTTICTSISSGLHLVVFVNRPTMSINQPIHITLTL